jgi:glycosyltransferase involved in cell wall biosynthesis
LWLPPYFYYLEKPVGLVCFHVIPRGVPPFPRLSLTGKVGQIIFNAPPLGKKNAVSQSKIGAVITHSRFMNEQILRIGNTAAAKKYIIPLGVDHSVFFPTDEEEPFALYLGRIHPQKGLELLIKAMEKTSSDYSLVIAGDLARDFLWYKEKLLALAEQANLSSRISIIEAPTSTQLVRLMHCLSVFQPGGHFWSSRS